MKFISSFAALVVSLVPAVTLAAGSIAKDGTGGDLGGFVNTTLKFINGTIIPFILAIAFLFFVWGVFLYFIKGAHSGESQEQGRGYIMSAIIGFVVILSFWGIIGLVTNGIGLNTEAPIEVPKTDIKPA